MKSRKIKSIFEISEDSNLAGVQFKLGSKTINWSDLTYREQLNTLSAWTQMCELFIKFLKKSNNNETGETQDN